MMSKRTMTGAAALCVAAAAALMSVACGGGGGSATATPAPRTTSTPGGAPTSTSAAPSPVASGTAAGATDPCTLRTSLEGRALTPGPSFTLNAQDSWQLCLGGVAAGSGEKYLYRTMDGGANWTLISETTLGAITPAAGVGAFPNGNGVAVMLFRDASNGWVGLTSPGPNLFRSADGGVTWTANNDLPPGLPVTAITFASATDGTLTTPDGPWHTADGGDHWTAGP